MPYQIRCRGCRSKLRIADALVERRAKCPKCARKFIFHTQKPKANGAAVAVAAPVEEVAVEQEAAEDLALASFLEDDGAEAPPVKPTGPKPVMGAAEFSKAVADAPPPPPPVTRPVQAPAKPALKKPVKKEAGEGIPKGIKVLVCAGVGLIVLILVGWFLFGGSGLGTVTGTLNLEGSPLPKAQVIFVGKGGSPGPFIGLTNDKGVYTITGAENKGIPPGDYKVAIKAEGGLKGAALPEGEALEAAREAGKVRSLVNQAYESFESTPLEATVTTGSNTKNLDLKKQP